MNPQTTTHTTTPRNLSDLLIEALPFVTDAIDDPAFRADAKPRIRGLAVRMRHAIEAQENSHAQLVAALERLLTTEEARRQLEPEPVKTRGGHSDRDLALEAVMKARNQARRALALAAT